MKNRVKRIFVTLMAASVVISGMGPGRVYAAETQETVTVKTEKDVYVQGGNSADSVMGGSNLLVKTPEEASLNSQYHRKSLVEFDLSEVPEGCNTAILKLEITQYGKQYGDSDGMGVYLTESGWDADTMTWNKFPERKEQVATAYKADIENDVMSIDVSQAVENALEAGDEAVSLELSFVSPQGGDHGLYIARHTAEGKNGPELELSFDQNKEEQDQVFSGLRTKWKNYILGDNLDMSDPDIADYVNSVNESAQKYYDTMNKSSESSRSTLWDDLPITKYASSNTGSDAKVSSGNVSSNFQRLKTLATAYKTPGGALYNNEELFSEIISGLDFMVDNYYNGTDSTNWGNWYHWEIGTPQALTATLMILYDDLDRQQLNKYLTGVERYDSSCESAGIPGSPVMTGANLLDKALVVAQAGVLTGNARKLEHVKEAQKEIYSYVTSDDGFYEDGSYIQHHSLAYTAGYGSTLYGGIGVFFYIFDGTEWAIQYEDGSEQMIYDTIFNSIEPLIYAQQMADSTAGRGIVRPTANTRTRAVGIINSILPIGASMKGDMKANFDSMVKAFIQTDEEFYFSNTGNITYLLMAKNILNDESVKPRENYSIHKTYAGMDRISHVRPSYMFNIAMSSTRQSKFENYSDEGYKLWNIADGMTYLYTNDLGQYTNDYWATVDPFRLAGTTVDRALDRKNFTAQAESGKTPYSWAGGVTLGTYGTAGVQMKSLGNENSGNGSALTGADSKKSWFMFDDEIVAVGSSITSDTGNCVETVIDNRQIALDLSNDVVIDGETVDITDNSDNRDKHGKTFADVTWANIEGNTEQSSIGYYFPEDNTTVNALKERRDSNYNTQSSIDKEASGSYATLWFDHGTNPENAEYEYVILPGKNAAETAAYADDSQIEILENNDSVHAVRHNGLNMTGINFWKDEETTAGVVTSDKKASVMMHQTDDTLEIAVSDPTQENDGSIELTVNIPCSSVIAKDDTISVDMTSPCVKIRVNTAGSYGKSHTISLRLSNVFSENAVVSIEKPETLFKEVHTEFSELALPETLKIKTNSGKEYDAAVVWSNARYDGDCAGVYTLSGVITLPEGVTNPAGLTARITVQVGSPYIEASQDTYVRDNSETGDQHKSEASLVVKNDASGYSRKAVVKLPIENIPEDAEKVYFLFELTGMPSETFTDLDLYETDAGWDQTSITWNNYPERGSLIANITLNDIKQSLVQKVDVTSVVKKAAENGEKEVSFEFSIAEYSKNNYTGIHSLESKEGRTPALLWEKTPNPENTVDKTKLQALYEGNKHLKETDYTPDSWAAFEAAMKEAEELLMKEGAAQEEIDKAVEQLQNALAGLVYGGEEPAPGEVDKSELERILEETKGYMDYLDQYTWETAEAFRQAYEEATRVFEDPDAIQENVDAAVLKLREAFYNLEEKEEVQEPDGKPDQKPDGKPDQKPGKDTSGNQNTVPVTGDTASAFAGIAGIITAVILAAAGVFIWRRGRRK